MPVTCNPWAKVVSEVATTRFIKGKTTIPVPQIHAYGKDTTLVKGHSTPFMLLDCIHGQQLHTKTVLHATESQRRNLYIDLINILAQLHKLEFPVAGSLMPNPNHLDDELNPVLGPFHSMTINEFERKHEQPGLVSPKIITSAKRFIELHCHMLSETYQLPTQELGQRPAKMEVFALDSIAKEIQRWTELQKPNCSFVLAHPDLLCGNIIIDENFHILSIIDWEFTSTIPQQFFVPPSWITGHDPDTLLIITGIPRAQVWLEFSKVLDELHEASEGWTQLWQDWGFMHENGVHNKDRLLELSPIVQILRHPSTLMDVYYSSTFRWLYGTEACMDTTVNAFFDGSDHQALTEQVEVQVQNSERYTNYLRTNNLLIPDERSEKIQEFLAKAKALLEAGKRRGSKEV